MKSFDPILYYIYIYIYIYIYNERVNFDSEPLYPFKKIKNVKKLGSLFVCIYTSLGSLSSGISDLAPAFQVKH
jgi:hypothetical protein